MKTYYITYYINRQPHEFAFTFHSQLAAIYKACMIRDVYGLAADVMEKDTGIILAILEPNGYNYIDENNIEPSAHELCNLAINDRILY